MQNFSWELCVKEKWVIQDHGPWTGCGAAPCEPTRCKDATSRRSGFVYQESPNWDTEGITGQAVFSWQLNPRTTPGESVRVWAVKAGDKKSGARGEAFLNLVYLAPSTTLARQTPLASPSRYKQSPSQRIRDEQNRASSGSFKDLQGAAGPKHRVNEATRSRRRYRRPRVAIWRPAEPPSRCNILPAINPLRRSEFCAFSLSYCAVTFI